MQLHQLHGCGMVTQFLARHVSGVFTDVRHYTHIPMCHNSEAEENARSDQVLRKHYALAGHTVIGSSHHYGG